MLKDKAISAIYLPDGKPLNAGDRVVQSEYAETLTHISQSWRRRRCITDRSAISSSTT